MSFPRQHARTQRFTLGVPRSFRVSSDGRRVLFLRSKTGTDPVACLWQAVFDDEGRCSEDLLLDPRDLGADDRALPPEERARRERARETASGVVSYTTDAAGRRVVCSLGGRLWLVDTCSEASPGRVVPLAAAYPAVDPLMSPDGRRVAYVHRGAVRVLELVGDEDRVVVEPEADGVTWGLAEFIAAEEMGRFRGMWWSPDSAALLAARVDERPVERWHIADAGEPASAPNTIAYPAAGTPNAAVSLSLLTVTGGAPPVPVDWDGQEFEYLVAVDWPEHTAGPVIAVQRRDQRRVRLLEVDRATGACTRRHDEVRTPWVEIMPGVPAHTPDGALLWIAPYGETRVLLRGQQVVTPPELRVRGVIDVDPADGGTVLFAASEDPTEVDLWTHSAAHGLRRLTDPGGVHSGRMAGGTVVVQRRDWKSVTPRTVVHRDGRPVHTLAAHAERPNLPEGSVSLLDTERRNTVVVLPSWYQEGQPALPVLMDPYGGPHAQRVLAAGTAYLTPRWFAEQGFAVVIADGRGSPGRGLSWETAIAGDLATVPLEDQVEALHAAAERVPALDLDRVAIRGWSFGGFLAACAVLRRPEVFHAAIAGAPVTDWRLYDTHYTERYLGTPDEQPERYWGSSLLGDAEKLTRPLLLIHGLADDNVVFAHTQRLSSALLAAARPHTVLPLSQITHMAADESVAENLLLVQVEFLRHSLGVPPRT